MKNKLFKLEFSIVRFLSPSVPFSFLDTHSHNFTEGNSLFTVPNILHTFNFDLCTYLRYAEQSKYLN